MSAATVGWLFGGSCAAARVVVVHAPVGLSREGSLAWVSVVPIVSLIIIDWKQGRTEVLRLFMCLIISRRISESRFAAWSRFF